MDNRPGFALISTHIMNRLYFSIRSLLLAGATLFSLQQGVHALEPRTWISLDGHTIDAELIKTEGDMVELKDKEGRTLKVSRISLSYGDNDYIAEFAPEEKKGGLTPKPSGKVKLPSPAKEMKFSPKVVKKDAGEIKLGNLTFRFCESPHFKILYSKGVDPSDTAELAERLWHDTAFFHASFAGKFKDRRMAIIIADTEKDYPALGKWFEEELRSSGNTKAADSIQKSWLEGGSTTIGLSSGTAADNGLLTEATVIRMIGRTPPKDQKAKGDSAKGVWGSFRTHVLAGDLMQIQAGGVAGFAKEGIFAIFTGHSFYKEIDLTGTSVTGVIQQDTGNKASAGKGYENGKNWAGELKQRIRKGDVKPSLFTLFASSRNDAKADDLALAYSFSRFLQSTPERHTAYGKLMERISTAKQVPDTAAIAKIYGLENEEALEKEWLSYVSSGDFR
jgi:hypothetical protein